MNIYQGKFKSKCPSDGDIITYWYTIYSERTIMVEDIINVTNEFKEIFHESAADIMHDKFGGKQILVATHQGISIKTIRDNK